VCLRDASAGSAESIILSAGGVESMMFSAFTESMILSLPAITAVVLTATDVKSVTAGTVASAAAIVPTFFAAAFS
jgi:hypothetical protein